MLGDDARLRQVLANLVTNSLKYTSGAVAITIMTKGSTVEIDVGDHGPGLESEAVGRAFDRFWRSADARAQPGSGLGLSIVRGIVAAHDGNVEMQSSAEGTHVRVSLPVAPARHDREDTAGIAGPRASEGGATSRQSDQDQPNSCQSSLTNAEVMSDLVKQRDRGPGGPGRRSCWRTDRSWRGRV